MIYGTTPTSQASIARIAACIFKHIRHMSLTELVTLSLLVARLVCLSNVLVAQQANYRDFFRSEPLLVSPLSLLICCRYGKVL